MSDNGGPLTVNGVHYDTSLAEAKAHFESRGFRGIRDMRKSKPLGCNEARQETYDTQQAGGPKEWWEGSWDYSARSCCIYTFECDVMPKMP